MHVECCVLAEKKTQPLRPGGAWVHGLWEIMVYVSLDIGRKQFGWNSM